MQASPPIRCGAGLEHALEAYCLICGCYDNQATPRALGWGGRLALPPLLSVGDPANVGFCCLSVSNQLLWPCISADSLHSVLSLGEFLSATAAGIPTFESTW